jgi:hypothetical protein
MMKALIMFFAVLSVAVSSAAAAAVSPASALAPRIVGAYVWRCEICIVAYNLVASY